MSKTFLIWADENILQAYNKFLVAAESDTMMYLEWLSSSLSGNIKLA
jgi:hypothetical protein